MQSTSADGVLWLQLFATTGWALTLGHLVKEGVHIAKASTQCVQGFSKNERQQWQGSPCSMQ